MTRPSAEWSLWSDRLTFSYGGEFTDVRLHDKHRSRRMDLLVDLGRMRRAARPMVELPNVIHPVTALIAGLIPIGTAPEERLLLHNAVDSFPAYREWETPPYGFLSGYRLEQTPSGLAITIFACMSHNHARFARIVFDGPALRELNTILSSGKNGGGTIP